MPTGLRYRVASVVGVAVLVVGTVLVANTPTVQVPITTDVPLVNELHATTLSGGSLVLAVVSTLGAFLLALLPLSKPKSRRTTDVVLEAQRRILVACFALATVGYFDYTYRLPRSTLIVVVAISLVVVPLWFALLSTSGRDESAVVVGDDPSTVAQVLDGADLPFVGYVLPAGGEPVDAASNPSTDGGVPVRGVEHLGGLFRLDDVLADQEIDTVVLAFSETDREEFFGSLSKCYKHGVDVMVPEQNADPVLTKGSLSHSGLVSVDLQPWDWQDRALKRAFDLAFAVVGLVCALPLIVLVSVAIKLDSDGPVLYSQERTAEFGDTFPIHKFRTMVPESEDSTPGEDENRITRVGRILRRTHLDEIPQLLAVLRGDMSVVGPRAAWTEEERIIESEVDAWRKRWFVKPGLTGPAQIRGVTSNQPAEKLRFDIMYVRNQSFWYDVRLVVSQLYSVFADLLRTAVGRR